MPTTAMLALTALIADDDLNAAIRELLIDPRISPDELECDETTTCQLKFLIALADADDIRNLCEMLSLCTMHHIDLEICIDDDDKECAHLR